MVLVAKVPEQMADEKRTHRKNILTLKKTKRGKKNKRKKKPVCYLYVVLVYINTRVKEPQKEKNEMRKKIGDHIVDRPFFFFFFPLNSFL